MAGTPLFEVIRDGERSLAVVVRGGGSRAKHNFVTAPDATMQLGVTFYGEGDAVAPHTHQRRHVPTRDCQELLVVQEGAVEVTVYREDGGLVARFELGPGEAVLFQEGGHALRGLAPARILEVKQGPYVSPERDKILLARPEGWKG